MIPKEIINRLRHHRNIYELPKGSKIYDAFDSAILAVRKQEPKEPLEKRFSLITEWTGSCPVCGTVVSYKHKYCHECGQRIKWGYNNERTDDKQDP